MLTNVSGSHCRAGGRNAFERELRPVNIAGQLPPNPLRHAEDGVVCPEHESLPRSVRIRTESDDDGYVHVA
jgi:hypothetical protein